MKKIPTLFVRDPDDRRYVLLDQVTPGCEWVLAGEGVPTRKYDGTCCMLDDRGEWWARREVKAGKPAPPGFAEVHHDGVTGKTVGWVPMTGSSFAKWHAEALENKARLRGEFWPATYELVGPKINGNPEDFGGHGLVAHGAHVLANYHGAAVGLGPVELIRGAASQGHEGVVWHHPDGRMAKLKVRDLRDV